MAPSAILDTTRNHTGCAVVYARNQSATIAALVQSLWLQYRLHSFVMDDGSEDKTVQEAGKAGAFVYENRQKLGLGPSMVLGWREALRAYPDYIIQLVAGSGYSIATIETMIVAMDKADMVIASRFHKKSKRTGHWWHYAPHQAIATACNASQPEHHSDWTSRLCAYRGDLLSALAYQKYSCIGAGWQIEALSKAGTFGATIAEVPTVHQASEMAYDLSDALAGWLTLWSAKRRPEYREIDSVW